MGRWVDGWMDGRTDGWAERWMDEWMDRWVDGINDAQQRLGLGLGAELDHLSPLHLLFRVESL